MSRVAIVLERLTHYRVPILEHLRERLASEGVELVLIVGQPNNLQSARGDSGSLPWAEQISNRRIPFGSRELIWQPCLRTVRSCDLVIVVQASRLLLNYLLLQWRPFGGPKIGFWGHGRNLDVDAASPFGEWLKRRLAARADWWFCYTERTSDIVRALGVPENRCTVLQNAVDTRLISQLRSSLTDEDLGRLRRELGIGSGPVGITLGSIYPRKRPEFLIEAVDTIRTIVPSFELIVIGDGPSKAIVDRAAAKRPWLHPVGALTGRDMVRHAALGELVLNPGLVGLAVLDAFALGLPMLTCDLPYHSPEIDYLVDGVNGAIFPESSTPEDFGQRVANLLLDRDQLQVLKAAANQSARLYTIEEMADRFASGVLRALDRHGQAEEKTL